MRPRHPFRATLCCLLAVALAEGPTWAIPPLVSGDVPTADHGTYELFLGYVLKDDGVLTEEEIPFWELVYGLRQDGERVGYSEYAGGNRRDQVGAFLTGSNSRPPLGEACGMTEWARRTCVSMRAGVGTFDCS